MKLLFVVLGLCIALAVSEDCFRDSMCDHETCAGDGWTVKCHHDGFRGTCTCEHADHTGGTCSGAGDCTGRCPNNQQQHCFDGQCRCF